MLDFVNNEGISSDDEEGGVFFGAHHPSEAVYVEKLSNTLPSPSASTSSLAASPCPIPGHQAKRIVKKRDSREFLRRKTLLLSHQPSNSNILREIKGKKGKGKGVLKQSFRGRDESDDESLASSSPWSSRRNHQIRNDLSPSKDYGDLQSDLTLDFSTFRVSDLTPASPLTQPRRNMRLGKEEDDGKESDDSSAEGDSDKENAVIPLDDSPSSPLAKDEHFSITLIKNEAEPYTDEATDSEADVLYQLDMGGLRLSDFSDPENGMESADSEHVRELNRETREKSLEELLGVSEDSGDEAIADEEESISDRTVRLGDITMPLQSVLEDVRNGYIEPDLKNSEVGAETVISSNILFDAATPQPDVPQGEKSTPGVEVEHGYPALDHSGCMEENYNVENVSSQTSEPLSPLLEMYQTPSKSVGTEEAANGSPDSLDSPLPIARGGLVVIPKLHYLAHLIPVETTLPTTPEHSPPSDDLVMTEDALTLSTGTKVDLIMSPGPDCPLGASTPISKAFTSVPGVQGRIIKPLKSSMASMTASVDRRRPIISSPKKVSKKEMARALAIREQVNAASSAVTGMAMNRAGLMGPPQRSVSSSSTMSSSSTNSRPASSMASYSTVKAPAVAPKSVKLANSAVSRPIQPQVPVKAVPSARPVLQARSIPQPLARPINTSLIGRSARPNSALVKPTSMTNLPASFQNSTSPVPISSNPLKRPLPVSGVVQARQGISLGPPSRPAPINVTKVIVPPCQGERPVFSIGVGGGEFSYPLKSPASRRIGPPVRNALQGGASRGTPSSARNYKLGIPAGGALSSGAVRGSPGVKRFKMGTPSRGLGTPNRAVIRAAPSTPTASVWSIKPTQQPTQEADTIRDSPSPPVLRESTLQATEKSYELAGDSASNAVVTADVFSPPSEVVATPRQDEVETQQTTSPTDTPPAPSKIPKATTANRPKRATKPPPTSTSTVKLDHTIAPGISEKELKAMTERNTSRNEVFFCAIDRQIIRRSGARPPSPKIRTIEEREAEEKKKGRGVRAKKRSKGEGEESDPEDESSMGIERFLFGSKAPGDDEDWEESEKPAKRAKVGTKGVKWDGEVSSYKGELGSISSKIGGGKHVRELKSCMRTESTVELDSHGNIVGKQGEQEKTKRPKVTINAIYYDGEEPVTFEYNKMKGKGGRGKKK